MRRGRRARPLALLLALAAAPAQAGFADRYYRLHYDYEVAAQCGMVSGNVERAFRAKRRTADAAGGLSANDLKAVRLKAYAAAAREYDNRGLGGHRQWCAGAAAESIRRILEPVD